MAIAFRSVLMNAKVSGSKVVVTCDSAFAGKTISCTKSGTTLTQICPSTSPYTVTFEGLDVGIWTISGIIEGTTFTTTAEVQDVSAVLSYGFVWTTWVDTASKLDSTDYSTLDELLADEEAVRELMLEHACVDYLSSFSNVTPNLEKVIENDLCAKWINNSDYALDFLGANTVIKALMDEADKYGYGEWVITDDTTTPPTWAPKGNVPVMTANNAPYGTASAYQVFDGNTSTSASGTDFSYKFVNPICPKDFYCNVSGGTLQASNDGSTWAEPISGSYYLYLRLHFASSVSPHTIQFYGRELKVSVPVMTSNTAPYGEAIASGSYSNLYPYMAFDGNVAQSWQGSTDASGSGNGEWVGYHFPSKFYLKFVDIDGYGYSTPSDIYYAKVQGSDDGTTWIDVIEKTQLANGVHTCIAVEDTVGYDYLRIIALDSSMTAFGMYELQFYGLDYSEKEFEVGTTKKWLYDHGVELETIAKNPTSLYVGTVEKLDSVIRITASASMPGTHYRNGIRTPILDLTPYSLLRTKIVESDYAKSSNNHIYLAVGDTGDGNYDAYTDVSASILPNNVGVNISAINGNNYVEADIVKFADDGVAYYMDVAELWLE